MFSACPLLYKECDREWDCWLTLTLTVLLRLIRRVTQPELHPFSKMIRIISQVIERVVELVLETTSSKTMDEKCQSRWEIDPRWRLTPPFRSRALCGRGSELVWWYQENYNFIHSGCRTGFFKFLVIQQSCYNVFRWLVPCFPDMVYPPDMKPLTITIARRKQNEKHPGKSRGKSLRPYERAYMRERHRKVQKWFLHGFPRTCHRIPRHGWHGRPTIIESIGTSRKFQWNYLLKFW